VGSWQKNLGRRKVILRVPVVTVAVTTWRAHVWPTFAIHRVTLPRRRAPLQGSGQNQVQTLLRHSEVRTGGPPVSGGDVPLSAVRRATFKIPCTKKMVPPGATGERVPWQKGRLTGEGPFQGCRNKKTISWTCCKQRSTEEGRGPIREGSLQPSECVTDRMLLFGGQQEKSSLERGKSC